MPARKMMLIRKHGRNEREKATGGPKKCALNIDNFEDSNT